MAFPRAISFLVGDFRGNQAMPVRRHLESWIPLPQLGTRIPPYRPTFDFQGYINDHHEAYATCPLIGDCIDLGRAGWLRREDALKLYELAYFSAGDILEVGSYHGLSTGILAQAVKDSERPHTVTSVEIEPGHSSATREHLTIRGLREFVDLRCGPAEVILPELAGAGREFGFVFLDHSHTYEAVLDACRWLPRLLIPGGFCLFHDFNDGRNNDPNDAEYRVAAAVRDGLPGRALRVPGNLWLLGALSEEVSKRDDTRRSRHF